MSVSDPTLKSQVKSHWENEVCGTRYATVADRKAYFDEISAARYEVEPYIPAFAEFDRFRGKKVLEIGVGAGSDFSRWVAAGAEATGIDLTEAAVAATKERLGLHGVDPSRYQVLVGDAERLMFRDAEFDLVYSYGVIHHTPDTRMALAEIFRCLKPGGELKLMMYGTSSWTALLLWVRYALLKGRLSKSQSDVIREHLESPGTQAYEDDEIAGLLREAGFEGIKCRRKLGPGDLLAMPPSEKYAGLAYRIVWALYPRAIVRMLGDRFGFFILIDSRKPGEGTGAG